MSKPKLLTFLSATLDDYGRRVFKGWNGSKDSKIAKDTRTAINAGQYGLDSNPVKGTRMIWSRTEVDGAETILGVWNVNQLSESGESRLFSTDNEGGFKFNVWLRANGEVLIGDSDTPGDYTNFAVRFNELETAFNELKGKHNDLLNEYKLHTHSGVTSGSSATGTTVSTQTPSTANIADSKNEKVKYND